LYTVPLYRRETPRQSGRIRDLPKPGLAVSSP
jgi:hypothetical protein